MKLFNPFSGRMMILMIVLISSITIISGCFPGGDCSSNGDCTIGQYCEKDAGDCKGDGSCEVKPVGCPEILEPVCGCNGVTYENDCFAAEVGQNVAYEGECRPAQCWTNDMCEDDEYCLFEDCGMKSGSCEPRPEICPDVWAPVCGCDGITYGNACEAASAGMSVDYEGECEPVTVPCKSNNECSTDDYCAKDAGDCEGEGVCQERPEICITLWDPVCGCDGNTYGNSCVAAGNGVNVDYEGECEPVVIPCEENADCLSTLFAPNVYCAKEPGDCDEKGECKPRPDACSDLWAPVCGCDGNTYGNDCEAAAAGVNISSEGECGPDYCFGNDMCAENEYCLFEPCAIETGICVPRPEICPDVWAPVCGCNGNTYGNACEAAAAGVSVDYIGQCEPVTIPCVSNAQCTAENNYCSKESGDCEGEGECKPRPDACYDLWAPVCGCDGKTYGNDCEAASAGVNISYEGECRPGPCRDNSTCEENEYCVIESCLSLDPGYCAPKPDACIEIYQPVCGCDNVTYSNSCYAAVGGSSVLHDGPCNPDECCFDQCGDGVCDQLMCFACGCPCYETAETCPQDCANSELD